MDSIYLVCAIAGVSLLAIQFVLQFLGGDAGGDEIDADIDTEVGDDFVRILSLKTLVSGAAFFGLSGMAARQFDLSPTLSLGIAIAAGLAAIYIVARLMAALASLQSKGNVDLQNACGSEATCYLRIPAKGAGSGRIHVSVQGRKVECRAVSSHAEIPTGAKVRVVAMRDPNTVEVTSIDG